ncbi:MAG: TonB-dependent receptor [Bacteroidales bacterium]|nr:TonB-dependent receptor [Bacteroidales bacterium]MBN2762452.1 TonB-dependent receptor [Bacteroidales bacterium]
MKKHDTVKIGWIMVAGLLSGMNVFSQASLTTDTVKLDEVVVTATKTLRNLKEVPARISIIRSSLIESTPVMQVDDILRYTAGINVNRTSGIYSQRPMVTLRGLSGDEQSRTLVLVNGVPVNTSDEGGVNWNRINPFDIERIEVFKGPGSSLYGNNAMGGVINIITKKPAKPQEIYGAAGYGTFNTLRQDLNIRVRTNKGYYGTVSQYFIKSDGYNNITEEKRSPYDIARSLEEIGVSARAGFDKSKWFNWELQYDVFRDKRGEGYQIYAPEGCYRNFSTDLFRGNLKGGDDKTQYDLNLFYQLEHYYDINEKLKGTNYSRYDVNSLREDMGALLNMNRELFKNNTLTGGLEIKQGSINGGDYYQTPRKINDSTQVYDTIYNAGTISTIAGYIQDEHAFFDNKIRLIVGLRYDRITFSEGKYKSTDPWNTVPELKDHTWAELSPRLGLRFNLINKLSAYLSYSHGFRASILDDLTRTGWMWVGPKYANPELGPESLNNYEIGLDVIPVNRMKIAASAYYAVGNDFLYYVSTGDSLYGRPIYIRENVTNVTIKGAEAEMAYEITKGLYFMAHYTFCDAKIDKFTERPELESKYLKYSPKHTASASLFWKNKIVNTSVRGFYKSEQFSDDANTAKLDSYFTMDVMLSKQILQNFIVTLDIQDVFDNQHMETGEYISPGRLINGRIAFRF